MIPPADAVMPGAAKPAPMGTACSPFDRGEVLGRIGQRCRSALDLSLSLPCPTPADGQNHRGGEDYCHPAHRCPPCSRPASQTPGCRRIMLIVSRRTQVNDRTLSTLPALSRKSVRRPMSQRACHWSIASIRPAAAYGGSTARARFARRPMISVRTRVANIPKPKMAHCSGAAPVVQADSPAPARVPT
jgi:hypothetical protein